MEIGSRLRELRESKHLSQGDVEYRTGLLRCYTSRVENSATVPSVSTLEKYARAFEVPLYRLFTDADYVKAPDLRESKNERELWGERGRERGELRQFAKALSRMNDRHRKLLLKIAVRMASKGRPRPQRRNNMSVVR